MESGGFIQSGRVNLLARSTGGCVRRNGSYFSRSRICVVTRLTEVVAVGDDADDGDGDGDDGDGGDGEVE